MKKEIFAACILAFVFSIHAGAETPKPKYGPQASPLSESHDYFRENPAPDFWSLIPYYAGQETPGACSVASVAMLINGARIGRKLTIDDKLATHQELLKTTNNPGWVRSISKGGRGVTLDQLGIFVEQSLKAYGISGSSVEVVHVEATSPALREKIRKTLVENEISAKNFIIANFNQKVYTDDADVGHIAPVGAYDENRKRVLILDPDRDWYEPYWVSEEVFIKGMSTQDKVASKNRGYVWIKLGEK